MIKTLRKKFVVVNMILVFTVLACVFTAFCVSSYRNAVNETDRALSFALESAGRHGGKNARPPFPADFNNFDVGAARNGGGGNGRIAFDNMTPVFVIEFDMTDNSAGIVFSDRITVSEQDLRDISDLIKADGLREGVLRDYNLRYTGDGRGRIALAEISGEYGAVKTSVLMSAAMLAFAMLIFFVISVALSAKVFKPVETAWRAQKQFVSDASHELKTPLAVILANVGIMRNIAGEVNAENTVNTEIAKWLDSTAEVAERMRELTETLLELAKNNELENSGGISDKARYVRFCLSDTVLRCALAFEPAAFELRKISINTDGVAANVVMAGNEAEIYRLVGILVDNAVKYADENSCITISLYRRHGHTRLEVRNKGVPIAAADMPRLFDRFYRADKARARGSGGAGGYGLGLAIAKNIAERHGAKIRAESDSGETVFSVMF